MGFNGMVKMHPNTLVQHLVNESISELQLVPGRWEGDTTNKFAFYFTEQTASGYKEYEVIKLNKHGTRQRRLMGIDRDKIFNLIHPSELKEETGNDGLAANLTSFLVGRRGNAGAKKPHRKMDTVQYIGQVEDDPLSFNIVYTETSGDVEYQFTCESTELCMEIVARVTFLMTLHAN